MPSFADGPAMMRLPSVDAYLGDGETRFFGEGYKRAAHRFTDILSADGEGGPVIIATAAVAYPPGWSRKGDTDQRPHLSTIDVLVLGVQVAELWLAWHVGLGEDAVRSAWIRDAQIKAGSSPVEDELDAVPLVAWRSDTSESLSGPERTVSILECTVSTLFLRIEVDHPAESSSQPAAPLDEHERRPFGGAYRARSQQVRDVMVAADRLQARAKVELRSWGGAAAPGVGIEGHFQPSIGLIDGFVVALQLGQILLYELDEVTRAESNTLWMRSTRWQASAPPRPETGTHPVVVELHDAALLRTRSGETWRRAEVVAELGAIAVTCSIAHQLPITATTMPPTQ